MLAARDCPCCRRPGRECSYLVAAVDISPRGPEPRAREREREPPSRPVTEIIESPVCVVCLAAGHGPATINGKRCGSVAQLPLAGPQVVPGELEAGYQCQGPDCSCGTT